VSCNSTRLLKIRSPGVILGFAVSVAFSAALPSPSVAPLPGVTPLPIGQLSWEGVVIDGEPPVEVRGVNFEVQVGINLLR
jgi:hypothetical protein